MLEVNFEAVKARKISTGEEIPIPAIKGEPGSGGDVTKAYVDEQDGKLQTQIDNELAEIQQLKETDTRLSESIAEIWKYDFEGKTSLKPTWELGAITNEGNEQDSANHVRTDFYLLRKGEYFRTTNSANFRVFYYDLNGEFIETLYSVTPNVNYDYGKTVLVRFREAYATVYGNYDYFNQYLTIYKTSVDRTYDNLVDDVDTINETLTTLISEKKIDVNTSGYRLRTSPFTVGTNSAIVNTIYPCKKGDAFKVKGKGGGIIDVWMFTDSSGNALEYSGYNKEIQDFIDIVAPTNSAFVVVNNVINDVYDGELFKIVKSNNKFADVIVDSNGKGDFKDIQNAIEWLKENYDVNNASSTVYIRNGIYDVVPKTDETHNNPTAIRKGANKISIIGESRDGVIINCLQTKTVQGIALETGGECIIANLTVNVLKSPDLTISDMQDINVVKPYCLHADIPMTTQKDYKTVVKNCKFYDEVYSPIGAGLNDKQIQRYENVECIYNSTLYNNNGALFVHAPVYNATAKGLEVVDCVCVSYNESSAMHFPNVSGYQSYANIPQTFIRNVTATSGYSEIYNPTPNKTIISKGNSNSALNA